LGLEESNGVVSKGKKASILPAVFFFDPKDNGMVDGSF
jgi:hypothetical protein